MDGLNNMAKKKRNKNGWNYRIVCRVWSITDQRNGTWNALSYGVHEVYYENDQPNALTESEVSPGGNSEKEFWQSTVAYTQAFNKPVLYFDTDKNKFVEKPKWI